MRDPHVEGLIYVITSGPGISYENPQPLAFSNSLGHFDIADGQLRFRPAPGKSKVTLSGMWVRFASLGLKSAYHTATGEAHGAELQSTHYLHRKPERPYHIDYCFVHSGSRLRQAQVGAFEEWRKVSDHVPVIVDVEAISPDI